MFTSQVTEIARLKGMDAGMIWGDIKTKFDYHDLAHEGWNDILDSGPDPIDYRLYIAAFVASALTAAELYDDSHLDI